MRRTALDAARTRDSLLDAALMVFCEKGVARTTLDDVARQAGLSRGAVYWHFEDKERLLAQTLDRNRLPLEELVSAGSLVDELVRLLRAVRSTACDAPHCHIMKILVQQSEWDYAQHAVRQRILSARSHVLRYLTDMLAQAAKRGELHRALPAARTDRLAVALQCGITGVLFESLILSGQKRRECVENTMAFLLQQVLNEPIASGHDIPPMPFPVPRRSKPSLKKRRTESRG